jgi:hypothetical protein
MRTVEAGTGTALVRSGYGGNGLTPLCPDRILPLVSVYEAAESPRPSPTTLPESKEPTLATRRMDLVHLLRAHEAACRHLGSFSFCRRLGKLAIFPPSVSPRRFCIPERDQAMRNRRFNKWSLAVGEEYVAVVEVCGFHDWLVKWLQQDERCHLVLVVQLLGRTANKTDRRDANALSELL